MPFISKILITTLVLLAILCYSNSYGQQFVIDTNTFLNPDINETGPEYYDYDFEPEIISSESLPADMIFVPTNVLYNNRWDTLNIRTGRTDWSKISDSAVLFSNIINENSFVFPFKGKMISPYGPRGRRFHAGMDIKLSKGDTVRSAFEGQVRIARTISGYGKLIVVRHNNGLETVYGHLSAYLVKVNQEVKAGQPIGLGGRTGRATTEHLHFETRILGEHFNPSKIIDFEQYCLKNDRTIMDKHVLGFGSRATPIATSNKEQTSHKYVKIRSGDTLYGLALKHKLTVKDICRFNGITPKKILKIGSKLRVQ